MNLTYNRSFTYVGLVLLFACTLLFATAYNTRHRNAIVTDGRDSSRKLVFGFYVNWDEASLDSLRKNIKQITHVVPVWLHLEDDQGNISLEIDTRMEEVARKADVPIIPLINNYYKESWRSYLLHKVLQSKKNRARLVTSISALLSSRKYAGINIDFELLQKKDREAMIEFMKELYEKLHEKGFLVTQSIPVDDEAYDFKELSRYVDFLIPMLYDEHSDAGKPGPIASQIWFEKMFREVQKQTPTEKLIAGLGSFGYDWAAGSKKATSVTFSDIMMIAREHGKTIDTTDSAHNPHFSYSDSKGRHEVWFLDVSTLSRQWIFAESRGCRGLALWRLGAEDPDTWKLLAHR